jgi:hypothetical protein
MPNPTAQFNKEKVVLIKRSQADDMNECLGMMFIDLAKIARGEVMNPREYARQTLIAASMIIKIGPT